MVKDYLKNKTYDDLKRNDKEAQVKSNLLEMTDEEKLGVIELLKDGKKPADIKNVFKRDTKSFTTGQIKSVERDWKEALAELAPVEDPKGKDK